MPLMTLLHTIHHTLLHPEDSLLTGGVLVEGLR